MCLPQCSCVSTQNAQRWSQQILMQLNSIKAEMWCDITAQWMTQFLKVWNETNIWARHKVNERQYGHFQQDNATAHITKKSMASLIPDLTETFTSVGTWKKNIRVTTLQLPKLYRMKKYANVSVLRINFKCQKICFFNASVISRISYRKNMVFVTS